MKIELSTIFTFAVSIITALGGYKAFELIINKTFNKKRDSLNNKSKENDLVQTTFKMYEDQLTFFKGQLEAQSQRVADLQQQINTLKDENSSLRKEIESACCYNFACQSRILKKQ